MPGPAKQPCYCVTCNGALMSNRTFRRHLSRPQVSRYNSVVDDRGIEETSGSGESDDSDLDLDRPTKRLRTGSNSMDPVRFHHHIL